MGTTAIEVEDKFLTLVSDYRLDALYTASGSFIFMEYLESWLLYSIRDFDKCTQDLTYTPSSGSTVGVFTATLTMQHQLILAQIMTLYWLFKTVNDILQVNNSLHDRDFTTFSQAQNLREKREYLNSKKEEIEQLLNSYEYDNNDWATWRTQVFY